MDVSAVGIESTFPRQGLSGHLAVGEDGKRMSLSNLEVFKRARVPPPQTDLLARRLGWYVKLTRFPGEAKQLLAAAWRSHDTRSEAGSSRLLLAAAVVCVVHVASTYCCLLLNYYLFICTLLATTQLLLHTCIVDRYFARTVRSDS